MDGRCPVCDSRRLCDCVENDGVSSRDRFEQKQADLGERIGHCLARGEPLSKLVLGLEVQR